MAIHRSENRRGSSLPLDVIAGARSLRSTPGFPIAAVLSISASRRVARRKSTRRSRYECDEPLCEAL